MWSGGKDSTATVILLKKHWEELIKTPDDTATIVFSEVMFDKKEGISGHNPDIINFIYKTSDVFKSWGFNVQILHSDKDYLDVFYHKLTRSPDLNRVGLTHGFVPSGICAVKRDCKIRPINEWEGNNCTGEYVKHEGIAIDEPSRLISLHKKTDTTSLLEKYNITEKDARNICDWYDMLSPQYSLNEGKQARDGCWFCPNAKLCEHRAIKEKNPEAWNKYVAMENEPDLAYPKWNPYTKETLHDRDEYLKNGYRQLRFDEIMNII